LKIEGKKFGATVLLRKFPKKSYMNYTTGTDGDNRDKKDLFFKKKVSL
jgi:hypothetical protein